MSKRMTMSVCMLMMSGIMAGHIFAADYTFKQITVLQYGSEDGRIGLLSAPEMGNNGPESFWATPDGKLYICDTVNQKIKTFSQNGKLLDVTDIGFAGNDLAVSNNGEMFVLDRARRVIEKIGAKDNKTVTLNNKLADTYFGLKVANGDVVLETVDQEETIVGRDNQGVTELVQETAKARKGARGCNGKRFKTCRNADRQGEIDVLNDNGDVIDMLKLPLDNVASIVFLGQDKAGNSYFQVEVSVPDVPGVTLSVYCLNDEGDLDSLIKDIPNGYFTYVAKLLQVTDKGDIYQVLPTRDNVQVNVWHRQ